MIVDMDREQLFKELLRDDRPMGVEFYADWCGPCLNIKPVFKRMSKEFEGRIVFVDRNIDEFPELAKS
ncbi:MAG TPA: thioredoxin domain-containing protein [Dehalococcoidia bacterium]|jgi:thioredoxin 1|nr:thioredoxin domain-containing protein [Dehalococcoidia bacterium]